jgi:tRNA1Val (adenine37-N6)-methyltransferase
VKTQAAAVEDALTDDPLTDDAIAGTWRVLQRARGHRYSLDDVATAWEAARARPDARSVCDLGCGIGSVAIMIAYKLGGATIAGIEAQDVSLALARRNVARSGLGTRVTLVHGDLRDPDLAEHVGREHDLVTGTPPYFDPARSSPSTDAQRTYARIEMRGGIEAYLSAASRILSDRGRVVVCGAASRPDRALRGAEAASLAVIARRDVIPRAGKAPLFTLWTLGRGATGEVEEREPLVARDENGARTEMAHALRRFFDLPVNELEPASPTLRARRAS